MLRSCFSHKKVKLKATKKGIVCFAEWRGSCIWDWWDSRSKNRYLEAKNYWISG